jgi:hypothetical protein
MGKSSEQQQGRAGREEKLIIAKVSDYLTAISLKKT